MEAKREFKATIFTGLFNQPERLRELYNALAGTDYGEETPAPEFIVLYNGVKPFPAEKTLKLSDAYRGTDKHIENFGNLELTVRVLNINPGYNDDLLCKSETLNEYTSFVEHIRNSQRNGRSLQDAIEQAINWGMTQGILKTFLAEHGAEVSSMIAGREFDINIAKEVWQEEAREEGREEGRVEGRVEEREEIARKLKESALLSIAQISQISGLSIEEVEKL